MTKTMLIGDFLTDAQLKRCAELGNAKDICREVMEPNIEDINRKLRQENDPMYLAYMVEHALNFTGNPQ